MRKQELKSRKKVHASKKRRTGGSRVYHKKEPEFVGYEPEGDDYQRSRENEEQQ